MEKQGVIKDGVTPPEKEKTDKEAAAPSPQQLEQDPVRRMTDKVADKTKSEKP